MRKSIHGHRYNLDSIDVDVNNYSSTHAVHLSFFSTCWRPHLPKANIGAVHIKRIDACLNIKAQPLSFANQFHSESCDSVLKGLQRQCEQHSFVSPDSGCRVLVLQVEQTQLQQNRFHYSDVFGIGHGMLELSIQT